METLSTVKPFLLSMGKNVIHCGESGNGLVAKLANNMLLGITMAGLCEALVLGKRLGLDPNCLSQVINSSSGRCWSSDSYNPVPGVTPDSPANRDYEGGFAVALIAKDLRLAKEAAREVNSTVQLGEISSKIYEELKSAHSRKDFSILYQQLSSQNGDS